MDIHPNDGSPTCEEISRACRLYEAGGDLDSFNGAFGQTGRFFWLLARAARRSTLLVVAAHEHRRC